MNSQYNITVNPTAFQLEAADGTKISTDTYTGVLRILRQHKRNQPKNSLYLVMDKTTDVPWQIGAWSVDWENDAVNLAPFAGKLTSAQRHQTIILHVTSFAYGAELGGYEFDDFSNAIANGHELARQSNKGNYESELLITSDFDPLDGITIPARPSSEDSSASVETEAQGIPIQLGEGTDTRPAIDPDEIDDYAALEQKSNDPVEEDEKVDVVANPAAAFATRMESRKQATAPALVGWRGFLNQLFKCRIPAGSHERMIRELHSIIQKSLSEHRMIAFLNVKGGAAKTTLAYLVCAILGRIRGGNILFWDNNENSGNAVERAIVPSNHEVKASIDLFHNLHMFETAELSHLLKRYVLAQGDNRFYLLPSQNEAADKQVIDGEAFDRMYEILRRFYDLMIVDTGNASNAPTWQASITKADQIVIASGNAEDAFRGSLKTIKALQKRGDHEKLANAVAVFTERVAPKDAELSTAEYLEALKPYVREVVVIPYDRALAGGGKFSFDRLQPGTTEAYMKATAAILSGVS